jgi:hypothetical protein
VLCDREKSETDWIISEMPSWRGFLLAHAVGSQRQAIALPVEEILTLGGGVRSVAVARVDLQQLLLPSFRVRCSFLV